MTRIAKALSSFVALTSLTLATAPAKADTQVDVRDIATIVAQTPGLKTLAAAVQVAELGATLQYGQDLTLFAPNDAAFAKLPDEPFGRHVLADLLANKIALTNVLEYHLITAKVPASAAVKLDKATMANGGEVKIRFDGNDLFINSAKVVTKDIAASNGVIHVIDEVLLP